MTAKRVKRPKLERDRPRREWSTLFGAGAGAKNEDPAQAEGKRAGPTDNGVLSDTVELGYRVVEDYLKQGQQAAQAFGAPSWAGGAGAAGPSGSDDMQQMAQRVMQYGWDFAGLWFEMWTRMGGPSGWPTPAGPIGRPAAPPSPPQPSPDASKDGGEARSAEAATLSVFVDSAQPTTTSVDLQPGSYADLIVPALRSVNGEGAPIKDVTIERDEESGGWQVNVVIAPTQRAGTYRAPIVEAATNLPRGSLSVRVQAKKR